MTIAGAVFALDRRDVDTDQIVPARFLSGIDTTGYGHAALAGVPGIAERFAAVPEPVVLVARDNFGCGSSREHAAWALRDRGFRAVVAPSFARIFEENAYSNGLVPIRLAAEHVETALHATHATIDVAEGTITFDDGAPRTFDLDPLRRTFILGGGYLGYIASRIDATRAWEAARPSGAG